MSPKRQSSKQRRAAQNRAIRAQREVRRERAGVLRGSAPAKPETNGASGSRSVSGSGGMFSKAGEWFSGLFGGAPRSPEGDRDDMPDDDHADDRDPEAEDSSSPEPSPPAKRPQRQDVNATGLVATLPDGTRLPGARATFVALVLAILAFSYVLVDPLVTVDDRGEPLPQRFHGLYLEVRTIIEGEQVEATEVTFADSFGWGFLVVFLLPLVVTAFAWYTHRKTGRSRPLTFGMLAVAVAVLFSGSIGQYFLPALIALAVGSFQARRAEMPARLAERAVGKDDDEADEADAKEDE